MDSFMDDDSDDEYYMFAGLGDGEDDEMVQSDDDTQSPNSSVLDPFDYVYSNIPQSTNVLKPEPDCKHCGAKRFQYEPPSFCFRDGKIKLVQNETPLELMRLWTSSDPDAKHFRDNIRYFNGHFSFTTLGGNERRKFEPSVTIYGNDRTRKSIQPFYGCYDPLSYPLFFPRGESGWHQGLPKDKITMEDANARNGDDPNCNSRIRVSVRDYYCYKMRCGIFNSILHGGRLFQQFAVDMYIKVESSRLDYKYGKPDVFLTMTSNPKWDEITHELELGHTPQDHPDLVVRVFRAKLQDLKKHLFEKHILGKVIAHVYVVEF
uniref:Helicase-like protein n=1 Tax=Oryza sativa subsp. japonica TaxID=39947 RepID=Q6Z5S8_ORYSJ|nr:helicase-like protein [Oryza sativa Japonica Group]